MKGAYSISRRLSWRLALQTAAGLTVLCAFIFAVTAWLFDRKHEEQWQTQAAVVREILLASKLESPQAVVDKMLYYADRRPGSFAAVSTAGGLELYRDQRPSFDIDGDAVRRGSFTMRAPEWAGGELQVRVLLDCSADKRMLAALALVLMTSALGGGAFVGYAVFWRVRRELAPVHDLAAQTRAIDADRLGQRLQLTVPIEELQPAVEQFNALMGRLERAYVQLEGFNADVAHELRTPLAALIGHTELALSRERSVDSLRDTLCCNLEELQRLAAMVNDMLFLASADRGAQARRGAPVSLAALARQVVDFHDAALDDAALQVRIEGDALAPVDEALVKRALSNLIGNATRYAERGSVLTVRIGSAAPDSISLEVDNAGPPIDATLAPRIFDRFFRADAARTSTSHTTSGSAVGAHHGLGLAIVAAIARMHAGQTHVRSDGGRTRIGFTVAAGAA